MKSKKKTKITIVILLILSILALLWILIRPKCYTSILGNEAVTDFFTWSVDSVRTEQEYDGYTASEGMKLVVADLTIWNTQLQSVPMFDEDFMIIWGNENDDYAYPISGSFATDFEIPVGEKMTGTLAFEVPEDTKNYRIGFDEYYEDGSIGDSYHVLFTVSDGSCFIGDEVVDLFFSWSVNNVRTKQEYDGYTASDGMKLVVADLTIWNSMLRSETVLDNDFVILWGDEDNDYAYPVSGSFATNFKIPPFGKMTGTLAFEVPVGATDCIIFNQYTMYATLGDNYFVFFTVK